MTILVNAVSAKMGGAVTYIGNLARELSKLRTARRFIFYVPKGQAAALGARADNIQVIESDAGYASPLKRLWWDQVTLRRIVERHRVDILYSSANFGLFRAPCKQVLLVRTSLYFSDLYLKTVLPRHRPAFRLEAYLRRWLVCRSVRWADVVMTPSRSLLEDLLKFVSVPAERRVVNYYGTDTEAFRPKPPRSTFGDGGTMTLLHVSHYGDHKNLGVMFRAILRLHEKRFEKFQLITTANVQDPRCPESVCRAGDEGLLRDDRVVSKVKLIGDVEHRELPRLYGQADLFVFPSIAESFGEPMVEAMASGLPIVAAETTINREILGDAALYFSPFDADEAADCILRIAGDPDLAWELHARAVERSQQFHWRGHVERLLEVFDTVRFDEGRR